MKASSWFAMAERLPATALRWLTLGEWRARPGRALTAALAIAIGVALGLAVHLVNRSALDEFGRAVATVNGEADLQVRAAGANGFAEGLYPVLARTPGVAAASPVVEVQARLGRADGPQITVLGLDILRAAAVTPSLIGTGGAGPLQGSRDLAFDAGTLFLSEAALARSGRKVGERIDLHAGGRRADFLIAGTLPGVAEGQSAAVVDIAAAQWRLGTLGRINRLDLKLAAGTTRSDVETAVRRALPAEALLVTPESQARRSDSLSRAYRVNLQMLALVALLTGGFLVFSAQSLSVARRRPQFALARVLGLTRRGLLVQVLGEGAVLGMAGALLGVGLGVGLAAAALSLFGGDLGSGYFSGERPPLAFAPLAAVIIAGLGLAVALAGSLFPALEGARVQAAVALKTAAGAAIDPSAAPRPWLGAGLLAAGGLAALLPPIGGLPVGGDGAMALLLAGGVAIMPWLARMLVRPLRRLRAGPALRLAIDRLWGAPDQAAIALCGIVASTSLMIAMAVMVTSFRGSVDEWLTELLPADIYIRVDPAAGGLDAAAQARMAAAPGIAAIQFRRTSQIRMDPDRPAVLLIARPVDRANAKRDLPLTGRVLAPAPGVIPVWVSEPFARLYDVAPGDTLRLPVGAGVSTQVVGVWRDYSSQFGAVVLDTADYNSVTGDATRTEAGADLTPGAKTADVIAALTKALPSGQTAEFAEPRQIRRLALTLFDRSFAVTYALEAIAIAVGLTGVAATFSAQTLARQTEFGMLRHVGVLRRQVLAMLAWEGALLGAVGAVAGLALGVAMSAVLIGVINPQSFNWTMETRIPWGLFGVLAAALTLTSAGAAVLAGRGAVSGQAVRAVREDW